MAMRGGLRLFLSVPDVSGVASSRMAGCEAGWRGLFSNLHRRFLRLALRGAAVAGSRTHMSRSDI